MDADVDANGVANGTDMRRARAAHNGQRTRDTGHSWAQLGTVGRVELGASVCIN